MALPEDLDHERLAQTALALLALTLHDDGRAWKSLDWDLMNRLHDNGWILDPRNKAKSVVLTERGEELALRYLRRFFATEQTSGKVIDLSARRQERKERATTPFVIRCTAALRKALPFEAEIEVPDGIPRLNQWHARLVNTDAERFVLVTNSETLYSVVLLGVDEDTFFGFDDIVLETIAEQLLVDELVDADSIDEAISPRPVLLAHSDDRRVMGSMNDFAGMVESALERSPAGVRERQLAKDLNLAPMGFIDMDSPLKRMRAAISRSPW